MVRVHSLSDQDRRLNARTKKDAFPLPRIDDSLNSLSGQAWFSTLDLASGYWQVRLSEDAKQKTAFATHSGLFQFAVMPFGLCNAPATFERLMSQVMRGLHWKRCLVYIDDILVFGNDCFNSLWCPLDCVTHQQHLSDSWARWCAGYTGSAALSI